MVLVAILATWARAAHDDAFDFPYIDFDHPAIQYANHPTNDVVSRLQKQLDSGKDSLQYDPKYGYLPSLLKHLQLNSDSQIMVFSKTSFQGPKISPKAPRAIYFNDDAAVGFVPRGDVMEVAALDPTQGVIFYTLDLEKKAKPQFVRMNMECMQCHVYPGTLNIPGLTITSVIPAPDGSVRFPAAATVVDSRTPFADRWGGWYVLGTAGDLQHRGNAVAPHPDQPGVLDYRNTQNLTTLPEKVDRAPYLEPTSDIVALTTIEHQTRVTNLLIRLGWETRIAMHDGTLAEFSKDRMKMIVDQLAGYMLFAGEARMQDPMVGVSAFTKTFPEQGPRDHQGRSLRDFDLRTRLFRYPLSYMIYSPAFDALPGPARELVYQRLYDVLSGKDTQLAHLSAQDRQAVLEIVRDTKPGLPAYWK